MENNENMNEFPPTTIPVMTETTPDFQMEVDFYDSKEQEDKLWQARTGLNPDTLCGAIETIVFMSEKPISIQKIKSYIDEELPLRVLHESLARLQSEYEHGHHGLRLQEVAEGYQFRTKAIYSKFVQDIFKVNSIMLTPSALEVLAMIAYKQPVSKSEIERIRGVDSSHLVRALMDKRLVKMVGRSEEELGRPTLFATTSEFLEVFNLANISDLPSEFELAEMAVNHVGEIADIKSIVNGGIRPNFNYDETEELDELSKNIKEINADTIFTKLLSDENKKRLAGEGESARSAFDILEEQVDIDLITKQNQQATGSETLTMGPEARIVDIEHEIGLLNAPQFDQEEVFSTEVNTLEFEKEELDEALDEAFAKLSFDNELSEEYVEETEEVEIELADEHDDEDDSGLFTDEEINQHANDHILNEAKKLDLDLDFLNDKENKDD